MPGILIRKRVDKRLPFYYIMYINKGATMERLIFGLISLLGLVVMVISGTIQSSFISGILFLLGMFTFGICLQEALTTRITLHQIAEEERRCQISQK